MAPRPGTISQSLWYQVIKRKDRAGCYLCTGDLIQQFHIAIESVGGSPMMSMPWGRTTVWPFPSLPPPSLNPARQSRRLSWVPVTQPTERCRKTNKVAFPPCTNHLRKYLPHKQSLKPCLGWFQSNQGHSVLLGSCMQSNGVEINKKLNHFPGKTLGRSSQVRCQDVGSNMSATVRPEFQLRGGGGRRERSTMQLLYRQHKEQKPPPIHTSQKTWKGHFWVCCHRIAANPPWPCVVKRFPWLYFQAPPWVKRKNWGSNAP